MILCVNSVLGMRFRTCRKFWESTDFSLVLSQNFLQIQKPHRNHFRCDSALGAESSKKNQCEAPENSPASWCKKSDLRLQKCNRRFFARSGESEALSLKAKSGAFGA